MMRILVPTAGSVPAKENVDYIVNIAKILRAELLALHILGPGEEKPDEETLEIFNEAGRKRGVPVYRLLWKGEIVSTIISVSQKESVDLVVMGASEDKIVGEWTSAGVMQRSKVPVVIIPYQYGKAPCRGG